MKMKDRVFPFRKYLTLRSFQRKGGIITNYELADEMNLEVGYISCLLYRYKKQNLVKKVDDELGLWGLTDKGWERFVFLELRVKVEGKTLRLPGKKLKTIVRERLRSSGLNKYKNPYNFLMTK
ncbi:MAG: hypothetical protein QMD22_11140 [archaeon]|nr:hypothetical protein [archaeon]